MVFSCFPCYCSSDASSDVKLNICIKVKSSSGIVRILGRRLLTAPEGVGEPAVDSAIELLVDRPENAGAELDEVDDEAAHYENEAHQQLQDEQALQVGQQSHG